MKKNDLLLRCRIIFLILIFSSLAIVYKIISIQFINKNKWDKLLNDKFFTIKEIPAVRGNILSDSGDLLATSLPFYELAVDPTVVDEKCFLENIDALSDNLSNFFKAHPKSYYRDLLVNARKNNKKYVRLNERLITYNEKKEIFSWPIFNLGKYKGGIILEKQNKRFYPFKNLAKRTIGYCLDDNNKIGIENSFDSVLKGTRGEALYQKIIGNNYKIVNNEANQKPIDGLDVVTTLNINLQDIAQNSLLKILKESGGKYGVVIIMDVATGHIKAMVNLKKGDDGQYRESYNYAVGHLGCVEPGSVIKVASMLALFEETDLKLDDILDTGRGAYKFHSLVMHDVNPLGYGKITVQSAFEKSSNIGIAKLVNATFHDNPDVFLKYLTKLQLDQSLDLGVSGECKPFVNNPKFKKTWSKDSLPWMSIGYEIKISPLHILTLYNAIANNGVMVKPMLVSEIRNGLVTVKNFNKTVLCEKICSEETLQKIHTLLEGVVQNGSASNFKHGFYQIAGKSGTANKLKNGIYTTDTITNFVGYFPCDNPIYSCIVTVDEPQGKDYHFASQVGAPVIKAIADNIASMDVKSSQHEYPQKFSIKVGTTLNTEDLLNIADKIDLNIAEITNKKERFIQKTSKGWVSNNVYDDQKIPNLSNMILKDVLSLLMNRNIKYKIKGNVQGKVCAQSINPGTMIKDNLVLVIEMK